jgi:hypothetical protein
MVERTFTDSLKVLLWLGPLILAVEAVQSLSLGRVVANAGHVDWFLLSPFDFMIAHF